VNVYGEDVIETQAYTEDFLWEVLEVSDGPYQYHPVNNPPPPLGNPLPLPAAEVGKWCTDQVEDHYYTYEHNVPGVGSQYTEWTFYSRLRATTTCAGGVPVPPDTSGSWTLLADLCSVNNRAVWWRCPSSGSNPLLVIASMKHGRDFNSCLQAIFSDYTVVSDFFNINPDATAPSNSAYTYAAANFQKMTLHQKSDVKRTYASDPAQESTWNINPKELLEDLQIIFNIRWEITGSTLRIEHVTFWTATNGLDLSGEKYKSITEADETDRVISEQFFWMDDPVSDFFKGDDITYLCGTENVNYKCRLITTDVAEIQHNANTDSISDEGFVICATTEESPTLRTLIAENRPLSFTLLHENLHRDDRFFKDGTLNGQSVQFNSYKKVREQPPFSFVYCCDTSFDPTNNVNTDLGWGEVKTVEYNIAADYKKITLKY
jgi:hypothetical protein